MLTIPAFGHGFLLRFIESGRMFHFPKHTGFTGYLP